MEMPPIEVAIARGGPREQYGFRRSQRGVAADRSTGFLLCQRQCSCCAAGAGSRGPGADCLAPHGAAGERAEKTLRAGALRQGRKDDRRYERPARLAHDPRAIPIGSNSSNKPLARSRRSWAWKTASWKRISMTCCSMSQAVSSCRIAMGRSWSGWLQRW